jgi:hypothetical protein
MESDTSRQSAKILNTVSMLQDCDLWFEKILHENNYYYFLRAHYVWWLIFFFKGIVLGFEIRTLHLLGKCSRAMHLTLFVLVIFEMGSRFMPRLLWTAELLFVFLWIVGVTAALCLTQPLVEMGVSQTFLTQLVLKYNPPNCHLPSS